jgi:DNA primase
VTIREQKEEDVTDTQRLKDNCDLRRLVEQDLGPAPLRGGRAYLWKCPFHNEHKGFSLAVWANGYRCFGACDTSGDALDWLTNYRRLSFVEALRVLGERVEDIAPVERKCLKSPSEPPEWDWQHRAERIVSQAEETLWSEVGEPALN